VERRPEVKELKRGGRGGTAHFANCQGMPCARRFLVKKDVRWTWSFWYKRVFITGASSGIGAAAARVSAEEGADVFLLVSQNAEGARRRHDTVKARGSFAHQYQMDVSRPEMLPRLFRHVHEDVDALDILSCVRGSAS